MFIKQKINLKNWPSTEKWINCGMFIQCNIQQFDGWSIAMHSRPDEHHIIILSEINHTQKRNCTIWFHFYGFGTYDKGYI